MGAIYSVTQERVNVTIRGSLEYNTWRVLRDARIAALERRLPLHLDVTSCHGGDMGGLGALMIAQHQLGEISIEGCNSDFSTWFASIGVCARCGRHSLCLCGHQAREEEAQA